MSIYIDSGFDIGVPEWSYIVDAVESLFKRLEDYESPISGFLDISLYIARLWVYPNHIILCTGLYYCEYLEVYNLESNSKVAEISREGTVYIYSNSLTADDIRKIVARLKNVVYTIAVYIVNSFSNFPNKSVRRLVNKVFAPIIDNMSVIYPSIDPDLYMYLDRIMPYAVARHADVTDIVDEMGYPDDVLALKDRYLGYSISIVLGIDEMNIAVHSKNNPSEGVIMINVYLSDTPKDKVVATSSVFTLSYGTGYVDLESLERFLTGWVDIAMDILRRSPMNGSKPVSFWLRILDRFSARMQGKEKNP